MSVKSCQWFSSSAGNPEVGSNLLRVKAKVFIMAYMALYELAFISLYVVSNPFLIIHATLAIVPPHCC